MKVTISILLIALSILACQGQWITHSDQVLHRAEEENRLILLNFSGSDWCAPCIRMKSDFFESEAFKAFAAEHLILVNADFPRKKRKVQSPELISINAQLADRYNMEGSFPKTLLLDSRGEIVESWTGYPSQKPDVFLASIRRHYHKVNKIGTLNLYNTPVKLMGSQFNITVVDTTWPSAEKHIRAAVIEIERIEKLISSWDPNSQTSLVNDMAGIRPVKVDKELIELIERSKRISEMTQGAFDITFGSIDKSIWHFTSDMTELPDPENAALSIALINHRNIVVNHEASTVLLKEKGMKIGFGAIGKGYAADMAKKVLVERGVESGIINASGDLVLWGSQPDGMPWTIGLANPENKIETLSKIKLSDQAIVTSGNYEKYVEIDGKKYCHIIDPRTGFPVEGIKSVTVMAPSGELADALATAVFVLGVGIGMDFIHQIPQVECIIIDDSGRTHYSDNIIINEL